jgi:thioredoxin 1
VINETEGKITLAKVDIDELTDIALDYDVQSVPVLLVMKNGKIQNKMVGLQDTDKLRNFVQSAIEKGDK